jgi:hypothetical protein
MDPGLRRDDGKHDGSSRSWVPVCAGTTSFFVIEAKLRSPDGVKRNPGCSRHHSRIPLRCIRATVLPRIPAFAGMTANMMVSLATCASTKRLRHCGEGRNPVLALLPWVPAPDQEHLRGRLCAGTTSFLVIAAKLRSPDGVKRNPGLSTSFPDSAALHPDYGASMDPGLRRDDGKHDGFPSPPAPARRGFVIAAKAAIQFLRSFHGSRPSPGRRQKQRSSVSVASKGRFVARME